MKRPVRIETIVAPILAFLALVLLVSGVALFNQFMAKITTAPSPTLALIVTCVAAALGAVLIVGTSGTAGMLWNEGERLNRLEEEWAKEKAPVYTGPPRLTVVR